MMRGLVEKASGHAIKLTADSLLYDKHLNLKFSYASHATEPLQGILMKPIMMLLSFSS